MIDLQNVGFQYKEQGRRSICGNTCTIHRGEVVIIAGESGCGKSTLLRALNGLCPHFYEGETAGKVLLGGKNCRDMRIGDISRMAATVFQNPDHQFFTLDVLSDLVFSCENFGVGPKEIERRLRSVTKLLQLERFLGRKLSALSGGEKQRIAIASALMLKTDILLMDEPSANLDYPSIEELRDLLALLKAHGCTIVVAEHRLYYLCGIADRLFLMQDGTIRRVYEGAVLSSLSNDALHEAGVRGVDPFGETDVVQPLAKRTAAPLLSLADISFGYAHGEDVLQGLSLDIHAGDRVALLGRNGCGKSTLAKVICGLLKERAGEVRAAGEALPCGRRSRAVSYVMQNVDFQLFGSSVYNDLLLGAEGAADIDARIRKVLDDFRLTPWLDEHPTRLSMGQKQRLVIAGACLLGKRVGIFDEPTSGLDYRNMRTVCSLIGEFTGEDGAAVIITHDVEFVMNSCNRVVLLEDGRIAEDFPLAADGALKRIFTERLRRFGE